MDGSSTRWANRPWLLLLVVAIAAAGAWYSTHRRASAVAEPVAVGQGRALLLDFGMGVCEQCKRMKPVMDRAARELGDKLDVRVLDIRQEDNEKLGERFNLTVIPLIVLVDGTGRELWRHEGFVDYEALSHAVRERLSSPAIACEATKEKCSSGG